MPSTAGTRSRPEESTSSERHLAVRWAHRVRLRIFFLRRDLRARRARSCGLPGASPSRTRPRRCSPWRRGRLRLSATPTAPAPTAIVPRRGDLPHARREQVHDVLVGADLGRAGHLLLETEHANEAHVRRASAYRLDGSLQHREPIAGEPGGLRDRCVDRFFGGAALRLATQRGCRRRGSRDRRRRGFGRRVADGSGGPRALRRRLGHGNRRGLLVTRKGSPRLDDRRSSHSNHGTTELCERLHRA